MATTTIITGTAFMKIMLKGTGPKILAMVLMGPVPVDPEGEPTAPSPAIRIGTPVETELCASLEAAWPEEGLPFNSVLGKTQAMFMGCFDNPDPETGGGS